MEIKKVLVISKMTELESDEIKYGSAVDQYYGHMNIDRKKQEENHGYHYESVNKVIEIFQALGVNPGIRWKQNISRSDFGPQWGWDLIVPVGGDGTFLDAARYIFDDTLFFGIKSSPHSVGGHYTTHFGNAREHIEKLLKGDYVVEKRNRARGIIQNAFTIEDIALNEILIGDEYNAGSGNMQVLQGDKWVKMGGSGLLISTYKGAPGWYDKVLVEGGRHKFRKRGEEDFLRYKLREKNPNTTDEDASEFGIIRPGKELVVISNMIADGKVVFDGLKKTRPRPRSYDFEYGNTVRISLSDKPLYVAIVK